MQFNKSNLQSKDKVYQSLDEQGKIIDVSDGWLEKLGYTREEVIGKFFGTFLDDKSLPQVQKNFLHLKDYGFINNVSLLMKMKNGTLTEVVLNGISEYDGTGHFENTICEIRTVHDILHSELEVKKMLDSERFLRNTLNLKANVLELMHKEHDFELFLNNIIHVLEEPLDIKAVYIVDGYLHGHPDAITNEVINSLYPTLKEDSFLFETKEDTSSKELLELMQKADVFGFAGQAIPLKNYSIYILFFLNEIELKDEWKNVLTEIISLFVYGLKTIIQSQELETIFNTSKDGIAILDLESNFLRVNKAYIDITGYTGEEILKKSCISMSIPEDVPRAKEALGVVFEKGFIENFEKSCYRKDGSIFTINMNIALMPDKEHLVITTKDVTGEVHLRKELVDAKEKAELISQFKSEFLANMSHEIRTPMNGILGFVEQLEKSEHDPKKLQQFKTIRSSGNTLLHIINDILDFSKIESGKMELESHPFSLYEIILETTGIFSELIGSKQIHFTKEIDEKLPACIMGDQVRIKQIIFNLLSNAIKFTPEKGTIHLDTKLDNSSNQIYIAISDTGIGIPQRKIAHIFEAFSQQDTTTTRKYGGTGLGLSITSSLIKKMGGVLEVESVVKKGSTFTIKFPLDECIQENQSTMNQVEEIDMEALNLQGHILIVEDNKTNQMLLSMILDECGLSYDIANDGIEALKLFNDNKYNIILMDENMPNLNGIEATNQIRLDEYEDELIATPIVAVTANSLAEDRQRFIDAGMDDYISKPYTEEDIARVLQKYLG